MCQSFFSLLPLYLPAPSTSLSFSSSSASFFSLCHWSCWIESLTYISKRMDLMEITGEHWHEHNLPISTLMDNWIQRAWGDTSMGMSGLTNQHPRLRLCEAEKTELRNNSSAVNVGTRRPHTTYLSKCYDKKWSLRDDFRRVPQGKMVSSLHSAWVLWSDSSMENFTLFSVSETLTPPCLWSRSLLCEGTWSRRWPLSSWDPNIWSL